MVNSPVKILVVNREINRKDPLETNRRGGLERHIDALKEAGYEVREEKRVPKNMREYGLIVAHPCQLDLNILKRFGERRPEVPLIFDSGYADGDIESDYPGYFMDSQGNYISTAASPEQLVNLVGSLMKH